MVVSYPADGAARRGAGAASNSGRAEGHDRDSRDVAGEVHIRAAFMKELARVLRESHPAELAAIEARMPPGTLAAVDGATRVEWLPVSVATCLVDAELPVIGLDAVRRTNREAVLRSTKTSLLGPLVAGAVGLFGLTPSGLVRFVPRAWSAVYRGAGELKLASQRPGEAVILHEDLPSCIASAGYLEAIAAGIEAAVDVCRMEGEARVERRMGRVAYVLRWREAVPGGDAR
jgi:hypothetical protein